MLPVSRTATVTGMASSDKIHCFKRSHFKYTVRRGRWEVPQERIKNAQKPKESKSTHLESQSDWEKSGCVLEAPAQPPSSTPQGAAPRAPRPAPRGPGLGLTTPPGVPASLHSNRPLSATLRVRPPLLGRLRAPGTAQLEDNGVERAWAPFP